MDKPIINSLLDLDYYKLTMLKALGEHEDKIITYSFKNRTPGVRLGNLIDLGELKENIDNVISMVFTNGEIDYACVYLHDYQIKDFKANQITYELEQRGNDIILNYQGKWKYAIIYETIFLSIINELYNRNVCALLDISKEFLLKKSLYKLTDKLVKLSGVPFVEFGTRRRFSNSHQVSILDVLIHHPENACFLGTSNVLISKIYNLKPIGTVAHEWFMVHAALDYPYLGDSQNKAIEKWLHYYPETVLLSDTFGSAGFFNDFKRHANTHIGIRHDSGDPVEFGKKALKFYNDLNIDTTKIKLVFSDGLNADKINDLYSRFKTFFDVSFGWGTNLTNDCGIKPLSLVIKATAVNGVPTVKLSDNTAKAIGPEYMIKEYKQTFCHTNDNTEDLIY